MTSVRRTISRQCRRLGAVALLLIPLFVCPAAHAGIPVFDGAALQNNIAQLVQWAKQLEEMRNQIENQVTQIARAEEHISKVSGIRDLGDVLNSEVYQQAREYLPTDWRETLAMIDTAGGIDDLDDLSRELRNLNSAYSMTEMGVDEDSETGRSMIQYQNAVAVDQNISTRVIDRTTGRMIELQTLVDKINTTTDLKASVDLLARINAEQVMLTNELVRNQAQYQLVASQKSVIENQKRERHLAKSNEEFNPQTHLQGLGLSYATQSGE
jgi:type IV secretion system protein VirB5